MPSNGAYNLKRLALPVNINQEETKNKFGYLVTEIYPRDTGKVICYCSTCNISLVKRRKQAICPVQCKSCERKAYWADWKSPEYCVPEYISDSLTQSVLGYSAKTASPKGHTRVIAICSVCYNTFPRVRRNIHPPVVCHSCSKINMWASRHVEIETKRRDCMLARYSESGLESLIQSTGAAENSIATYISFLNVAIKRQIPIDGRKTLDIVIPDYNIAIEYNGLFWHHEHSKTPRGRWYHHAKMTMAKKSGIRLITIFEDEWLDRQEQVKAILRNKLNINQKTIFARKCVCEPILPQEARNFINQYHLQKLDAAPTVSWGLFYENGLVGVLTLRHDYKADIIVLNRLCFKADVRIPGGASKLFAQAKIWAVENKYTTIKTWSDTRWSDGNVYPNLGFKLARDGAPDYAYVDMFKPRRRITKETQQKSRTNCPSDKTEVAWALERGLARIWDCGHKRWELKL